MPAVTTNQRSGNQDIDGLLSISRWGNWFGPPSLLYYSFPKNLGEWTGYPGGTEPYYNFDPLRGGQQNAVSSIFMAVERFTELNFWSSAVFNEPASEAEFRFGYSDDPYTAQAYVPADTELAGDVWFNNSSGFYDEPIRGNYAYFTFMHEIGHALGLVHGHEGGPFGPMGLAHDNMNYSVMSYRSYYGMDVIEGGYTNEDFGFSQTFMIYDIAALQYLYGANFDTNNTDSIYRWDAITGAMSINGAINMTPGANRVYMTVWDGGGEDTYDLSNYDGGVEIDLNPGKWTKTTQSQLADLGDGYFAVGNIANALLYEDNASSLIENAIGGSGDDRLNGNQADNILIGQSGNDTFVGGPGADSMDGGFGMDVAIFSGSAQGYTLSTISRGQVLVSGPDGVDTLTNVERIQFADEAFSVPTTWLDSSPSLTLSAFGAGASAGAWSSADRYPRIAADVDSDGRADIIGFGDGGVQVSLASSDESFADPFYVLQAFGSGESAGLWNSANLYPRMAADVNGDDKADLVGFGDGGVQVALANSNGSFDDPFYALEAFGAGSSAGGWIDMVTYQRSLADVDGDGLADIIGFGEGGVQIALASGNGVFANPFYALTAFGAGAAAGGWVNADRYPRTLADVNGDGMADIIGFGDDGVQVALANGGGGFAAPYVALRTFGAGALAGNWTSNNTYPRMAADVNGDLKADLIGFGDGGVYIAIANSDGSFAAPVLDLATFGAGASAGSWSDNDLYPRLFADVDADNREDLIAFGDGGTYVAKALADEILVETHQAQPQPNIALPIAFADSAASLSPDIVTHRPAAGSTLWLGMHEMLV